MAGVSTALVSAAVSATGAGVVSVLSTVAAGATGISLTFSWGGCSERDSYSHVPRYGDRGLGVHGWHGRSLGVNGSVNRGVGGDGSASDLDGSGGRLGDRLGGSRGLFDLGLLDGSSGSEGISLFGLEVSSDLMAAQVS